MNMRISLMSKLVLIPIEAGGAFAWVLMRIFLNFLVEMLCLMAGSAVSSGECEAMTSFMMLSTSFAMQDCVISNRLNLVVVVVPLVGLNRSPFSY